MKLAVRGIASDEVRRIHEGGADANGQPALVRIAEGLANPCRHCLELIAPGDEKLVLAYRPFATLQPYAETGPIFLHKQPCARYESDTLPAWFVYMDPAIIRGYDGDDWIRYETGDVVAGTGPHGDERAHPRRSDDRVRPHPIEVQLLPVSRRSRVTVMVGAADRPDF